MILIREGGKVIRNAFFVGMMKLSIIFFSHVQLLVCCGTCWSVLLTYLIYLIMWILYLELGLISSTKWREIWWWWGSMLYVGHFGNYVTVSFFITVRCMILESQLICSWSGFMIGPFCTRVAEEVFMAAHGWLLGGGRITAGWRSSSLADTGSSFVGCTSEATFSLLSSVVVMLAVFCYVIKITKVCCNMFKTYVLPVQGLAVSPGLRASLADPLSCEPLK